MSKGEVRACLIRADGSRRLGMGHIVRTLTLADGLRNAGFCPVFVTQDAEPRILSQLGGAGYPVEALPEDYSFHQDLKFTTQCIERYRPGLVVTDLCNNDTTRQVSEYLEYLSRLRQQVSCLLTIDDLHCFDFPSHIVVNPQYGAQALPYPASQANRYLLGPDYFLVRNEFTTMRETHREIRLEANRVLVTLGGGDQSDTVEKVLRALLQSRSDPPVTVRVGFGLASREAETAILRQIDAFSGRCRTFAATCNMANLMWWSDVAITGGGLTRYETALTGTPSLVLAQSEDQRQLMPRFSQEGSCIYLGPGTTMDERRILEELEALLGDYQRRRAMSVAGQRLVDGRGVERVLAAIEDVLGPKEWPETRAVCQSEELRSTDE